MQKIVVHLSCNGKRKSTIQSLKTVFDHLKVKEFNITVDIFYASKAARKVN